MEKNNSNEHIYKIYVYTNKVNNKKYVGQTRKSLKERAGNNGRCYNRSPRFWNAIQKYGWDNFSPEILYDNLTKDDANELEIKTIYDLQTTNDKYGYNIAFGGNGGGNPKSKIPVVQFDLEFNYIKRYDSLVDAGHNTNIDKSHIASACKHKYFQSGGFIWLFEKDYLSNNYNKESILNEINKEYIHPNAKMIVQCDLEMNFVSEYKNICDASRITGINRNCINDNCSHKLKTSGGYIWMYKDEYEKNKNNLNKLNEISINALTTSHNKYAVVQLDKNMKYIADYSSILEASKNTKIDRKSITYTCKGIYKQAGGYIWCYVSDYQKVA